jgi:hypothetical protein
MPKRKATRIISRPSFGRSESVGEAATAAAANKPGPIPVKHDVDFENANSFGNFSKYLSPD